MKTKMLNDIKGFEDFKGYEIREDGKLFTYWHNGGGNHKTSYLLETPKEIKEVIDYKGYVRNNIGGRKVYRKSVRRHRLVALAFIDNPNNYPQVGHKDGNKLNNNVCNLYWCNNSINQQDSYKLGEKKLKYNEEQIKIMCDNWDNMNLQDLSKLCGINTGSMYDIYKGKAIMYKDIVSKFKKSVTTSRKRRRFKRIETGE